MIRVCRIGLFILFFCCGCQPLASLPDLVSFKPNYKLLDCPAISDVSLRPMAEKNFDGEQQVSPETHERFLYSSDHTSKVGWRDDWGGAITYWGPDSPGGNRLGISATEPGLQFGFRDHKRPAWQTWQARNDPDRSRLRIQQSVHFVGPRILEITAVITNLSDQTIDGEHLFPQILASAAPGPASGTHPLATLDREPQAATSLPLEGFASFYSTEQKQGFGVYWENRTKQAQQTFELPAASTVNGRLYLVYGTASETSELARELDHRLPAFGRIDGNDIAADVRTVNLSGWALDNKSVTKLELWINGKRAQELSLSEPRGDICKSYPGYHACQGKSPGRIGFQTTYQRPAGEGCAVPVEGRAQDDDGNWRVIARQSVLPALYK